MNADALWLVAIGLVDSTAPFDSDRVREGDLLALVDRKPAADLDDPATVVKLALDHHAQVVAAWDKGTVLPIRFGAVLTDAGAVKRLLAERQQAFAGALRRIGGLAEWDLIVAAKPEAPAAERPASGRAFLVAKRERLDAARGLRNRLAEAADRVTRTLKDRDIHVLGGVEDIDEVQRRVRVLAGREPNAMSALLDALSDGLAGIDCAISAVGPWPPYAYVKEISNGDPFVGG